jgi:hypothetical protein
LLANSTEESEVRDPWVTKMCRSPAQRGVRRAVALARQPLDEPGADGCGLVDHVQVTLFPVITGQTGLNAIF